MDRREISAILATAGLRPRHEFGQNFMVDQNILRAIADAGDVAAEDVVLEIGPGVGNLTRLLSEQAGAVLAVDIDRKLLPAARRHHTGLGNVTWLLADALAGKHAIEPAVLEELRKLRAAHPGGSLRLVSNLPYNAASPIIAELLVTMWREIKAGGTALLFAKLAFTVQYEVAQRMRAKPGGRDYGPLGILLQIFAGADRGVEVVRKIPAGAFWPPPKIDSALVRVTPDAARMAEVRDAVGLQELLAGVFSHRRQTLGNALKHYLGERWTPALKGAVAGDFDLSRRPEMLAPGDFLRLRDYLG